MELRRFATVLLLLRTIDHLLWTTMSVTNTHNHVGDSRVELVEIESF